MPIRDRSVFDILPLGRRSPFRVARRPAPRRIRPRGDGLESRCLLTGYYPAVGDYNGDRIADIAAFRFDTVNGLQVGGRNSLLIRLSKTGTFTGEELGYSVTDAPTPADFDGDGKTDAAVYGFLNNTSYGITYGPSTTPGTVAPYPFGSGRFAYIPSSGNYPAANANAVNGTMNLTDAKAVIVNIGGAGDLPAPADYDGDGKADFAVYEPSKGQFLFYNSSTFNPNANPSLLGGSPTVLRLGFAGDLPASADYLGTGHPQFATYDAASGHFFVQPTDGSPTFAVALGGPGDVPVSADFEGIGRADYAVYDPARGIFLVRPSDGSATRIITDGSPGDVPAIGRWFGDGRVDFGTYTAATGQFHTFGFPNLVGTESLIDPDAIPIHRTDDYAVLNQARLLAMGGDPTVLFLGDSITDRWPLMGPVSWQSDIAPLPATNYGESGDTTQDILWRINNGELDNVHPRLVVLEAGPNDLVDRSAAQIAHSLRVIMDRIHAELPGTSILLIDVLPEQRLSASDSLPIQKYKANADAEIRDLDQNYFPQLAQQFNLSAISGYASGDYSVNFQSLFSINPSDPNDYYANPALFDSLLIHPNATGYQIETNSILTPIRFMLHRPIVPVS